MMKYHRLRTEDGGFYQVKETDTKDSLREASVDDFILDFQYHNGPYCLDCEKTECKHCEPDWYLQECPAPATQPSLF